MPCPGAPLALLFAALRCAACSSEADITLESAPTDLATAVCGRIGACSPTALAITFGTADRCLEQKALGLAKDLHAPGAAITDAGLRQCLSAIRAASCDDILGSGARLPACEMKGTLANGSVCGTGLQCRSGACAGNGDEPPVLGGRHGCGVCKDRVGVDAACANDPCEAGLYCRSPVKTPTISTPATCIAFAGAGERCADDPVVAPRCRGTAACLAGICGKRIAEGSDCPPGDTCEAGLTCVFEGTATTGKCTKQKIAAAGESCGYVSGSFVACGGASWCTPSVGVVPGKCKALPTAGQDCSESEACLAPARCLPRTSRCYVQDPATCNPLKCGEVATASDDACTNCCFAAGAKGSTWRSSGPTCTCS
jgi:hypothetical protein